MAKILVIEDNLMIRENICEYLDLNSYHVRSADNGHDGLIIAREWIPDLILCDILMPELDGYGVLHEIQSTPGLTTIPLIFLTAKSERSEQKFGLELGALDYLAKPFEMNELISCVENGLKKAEELQKQNAGRSTLDLRREQALALKRLEPLIRVSNNRIIPKGEYIFREGDFPQFLYYIDKGQVRLFVNSTDEKNLVFKIHEAHDFLGHVAILQNQAYEVTAQALEECQIRELAIEDFLTYYQQYPEVALWFSHLLEFDLADRRQLLLMLLLSY